MDFLEQFDMHPKGITVINLNKNSDLTLRQVGELVGEIFACYGWGIMNDYTFDCLKGAIKDALSDEDAAQKVIEGLKY